MQDELRRLTADDIQGFVNRKDEETLTLEFKRQLDLNSKAEKLEAAKDVSGMANARGGRIIYGIEEKDGCAESLHPLAIAEHEERLSNVLDNVVSPRVPARLYKVEIPGGCCLVVDVPSSDYSLHMVQAFEEARYYRRGEKAVRRMAEPDVAHAYERIERLKGDARKRVEAVLADEWPSEDDPETSVVVIPLGCGPTAVDVVRLRARIARLPDAQKIIGCSYSALSLLLEGSPYGGGFQSALGQQLFSRARGLALRVRRDGVVHTTDDCVKTVENKRKFFVLHFLRQLHDALYLANFVWTEMGIRGPFRVLARASLWANDAEMEVPGTWAFTPIIRAENCVVRVECESSTSERDFLGVVLKVVMDQVWNHAGRDQSPWFDENGVLDVNTKMELLRG